MNQMTPTECIAFEGSRKIAAGTLREVALKTKEVVDQGNWTPVLIFDDVTSQPVEIDFRGTPDEVLARLPVPPRASPRSTTASEPDTSEPASRGPGRPKLGVVAHEVTLLPRHWEWLSSQPGGASVTLRKLVEAARKTNQGRDEIRLAQESAYRFLSAIAGNLPGFEEAVRALFASNVEGFRTQVKDWPEDLRAHAVKLAERGMGADHTEKSVFPNVVGLFT